MKTPARIALDRAGRESLERSMLAQLQRAFPRSHWLVQYDFAREVGRRFRADIAEPFHKLLIECQGSTWTQGRHTRGAGYESDCERMAIAQILGFDLLQFTKAQIDDGRALALVERWFEAQAGFRKASPANGNAIPRRPERKSGLQDAGAAAKG